jgi:hypothetical protein
VPARVDGGRPSKHHPRRMRFAWWPSAAARVLSDPGDVTGVSTGVRWLRRPSTISRWRAEGGAPMEELAIAGLIGFAAGYGARLFQETFAKVVKGPGQAAVRTVGSALETGAGIGGRTASAGASLGTRAVRSGVATMASGASAASRVAMRRVAGTPARTPMTRVPVSDRAHATPSGTRTRRTGSTGAGSTRRSGGRTSAQPTSRPSRGRPAATGPADARPAEAAPPEMPPAPETPPAGATS